MKDLMKRMLKPTMTLKEMIAGNSNFQFYRDGSLWYRTEVGGFAFPVPIEDIGNATFSSTEKSIHLMRYIRKWIAILEGK